MRQRADDGAANSAVRVAGGARRAVARHTAPASCTSWHPLGVPTVQILYTPPTVRQVQVCDRTDKLIMSRQQLAHARRAPRLSKLFSLIPTLC